MERTLFKEEHHQLRQMVKDFIRDRVLPYYETWEEAGVTPRDIWLEAGKNGLLCPTASYDFGGAEADFLSSMVIGEELYYHGTSSLFIHLHNDIVFPYLDNLGTPEQKERFIPKCVSGETILALAMTEPDVGSDLAQLKTKAVKKGDHYVVNGSKTFISNGQLADLFIVAVRTDTEANPAHRGISLLAIEANNPGLSKGRNLKKIGMHAQDTSEIFFEDCVVPVENLLGVEGKGFKHMMSQLQQERLSLAIGAVAAAKGSLEETISYVKNRKAFGKNLSEFQNTRFELAEVATKIQVTQSFIDDLIPRHIRGEVLTKEVSMAKYWATQTQFETADRCLQLFGGYGYMKEYPISRFFVDARVQCIYGGANEIMKELVARELLKDD